MTRERFISVFRDAHWLNRERIMLWATCFAFAWVAYLFWDAWMHSSLGITDAKGEHIGRDFINYWGGAHLAAEGRASVAYVPKEYLAFQRAPEIAGPASEFKMYSYPPVAMLLTLPLALVGFGVGFVLWSLASYALTAKMLAKYVPPRAALVLAIATPVCLVNIQSGQNGAFTAALLAGGLLLLDRKPVLAGVLLGLLCYKPQIGLLLPVALGVARYWKAFAAAGATVVALVALSGFMFGHGADIWLEFLHHMNRHQSLIMEEGAPLWHRMPTVFATARMSGLGLQAAYAFQALSALVALFIVAKTWMGRAPLPLKSAVLVTGIFLFSPYAWDYDMVVMLFALLWVAEDAKKTGWQPWEKFAWLLLILMPLHMTPMSKLVEIQLGCVYIWAVMALLVKRLALPRA